MVAENDGRKRMGDSVGRAFFIGISDDGSIEGTDGRALPVYKMGENIGKYSYHKASEESSH